MKKSKHNKKFKAYKTKISERNSRNKKWEKNKKVNKTNKEIVREISIQEEFFYIEALWPVVVSLKKNLILQRRFRRNPRWHVVKSLNVHVVRTLNE